MSIFDKLKDLGLTEESLVELKTSIESQINEAVEDKVKTMTDKVRLAEEESYKEKLEKTVDAVKQNLVEEYDQKMEDLEEKLVDALDQFLESEINENISDALLEKIAINETLVPLFKELRNLFEEKYIDLDTEGEGVLRAAKQEIEELDDKLSNEISEKMDLKKELESAKVQLLIAQKTSELTEAQAQRVEKFMSDKSFDEVNAQIDNFVSVVVESPKATQQEGTDVSEGDASAEQSDTPETESLQNDDAVSENDGINEDNEVNQSPESDLLSAVDKVI